MKRNFYKQFVFCIFVRQALVLNAIFCQLQQNLKNGGWGRKIEGEKQDLTKLTSTHVLRSKLGGNNNKLGNLK